MPTLRATVADLKGALERGALLLDVREGPEFRYERIEGSEHAPLSGLAGRAASLPKDRDVYVVCQAGVASASGARLLAEAGCSRVFEVEGGLEAWKRAGLPVRREGGVIPVLRQVQIAAGSLVLVGTLVPGLRWLAVLVGAGLVFSGASGTCMMAGGLSRLPWNRGK